MDLDAQPSLSSAYYITDEFASLDVQKKKSTPRTLNPSDNEDSEGMPELADLPLGLVNMCLFDQMSDKDG